MAEQTYRVETDQGTFNVTLDRAPSSDAELRQLVEQHLAAPAGAQQVGQDVAKEMGGVAGGVADALKGYAALAGQVLSPAAWWRGVQAYGADPLGQLGRDIMGAGRLAVGGAPEMVGGTAASLLGPEAVPLGMAIGRTGFEGLKGLVTGQAPPDITRSATAAFAGGIAPAVVGAGVKAAVKVPGRFLSLPGERHATGAAMMEAIPDEFGVDAAKVASQYAQAERLSAQTTTPTPLMNFRQRVADMRAQLETNPVEALRDAKRIDQLTDTLRELGGLRNEVTPRQADALIKRVNAAIGDTTGSERGMWKQMLGGLHDDMRAAASATGDPAYTAYAQAIRSARLNFLKEDLQDVIQNVGVVTQRTGAGVITSPGKILQWMKTHPEWSEAVAKEKPGLLESIGRDLQEIIPITDVVGRGIPGQRFGSGRLVLGAAAGHLISKLLGWAPGTAESVGALAGGLFRQTGVEMSPGYIRRSFQPMGPPAPYPRAALTGGVTTTVGREADQR